MARKIMAWSKCKVRVGVTPTAETMAESLTELKPIKDKSASLEPSDGDSLEAKATGGELVARESLEGGFKLTYRVIEPDDEFYSSFGLGTSDTASNEFRVQTHVVESDYSVEVEPKNVGAKGIRAPKTSVTLKPGWSEEEGNYCDVEHEVLKGDAGYWYSRFTKAGKSQPNT